MGALEDIRDQFDVALKPCKQTTMTSFVVGTASVLIVPADENPRRTVIIHNDGGSLLFVAYAPVATTALFTWRVPANNGVVVEEPHIGPVSAVRASGNGPVLVTIVHPNQHAA